MATHVGCSLEEPTRSTRARRSTSLDDFIVTADTTGHGHIRTPVTVPNASFSESYKVDLFFPSLDHILSEMRDHFTENNLLLMRSLDCLRPKSKRFLDFQTLTPLLDHYNIESEGIETEILTFKNFLSTNPIEEQQTASLHDVLGVLTPLKSVFPILTKCTQIALTIVTSTATVERSFSSLRRIHTSSLHNDARQVRRFSHSHQKRSFQPIVERNRNTST